MNTFVVKSHLIINGQCIGISKDGQHVYIFRSHKVFKDANPDLKSKDYIVIDDMDETEFDFPKYNVCSYCGGLKYWYRVSCDKPMNGNIVEDEDGFALFDEEISSNCVCDDGTYIGYLRYCLEMEKRRSEDARKDYIELRDYIRKTSTCKTCEGHQETTLGLCVCEECNLPGRGFWPG